MDASSPLLFVVLYSVWSDPV